ncbi:MAG: response regulator transcription factor [Saprospiraceae bacterium]|nr:response regulator transcription factor [Saprospiraceae bacterium]
MINRKNKILIVDDEPDIIEFLSYNLNKEGYEVFSASNGVEAIENAKKYQPDLILLDIMMPEIDGIEVCRRLRKIEDFRNTYIAFLTARGEDFTQINALDAGGDDYITKPIKPKVLVARLKAHLRRSENENAPSSSVLKFGILTIDKEKMQILVDDNEVALAKKEFELILLLSSKPGKVFDRREIYSKIWGDHIIVGDRTIDVHIRKIREKLGENIIKTIKGIGYKLDF